MTVLHVLNYTIPIAFIVFAGFILDKICKPNQSKEETGSE